MSFSGHKYSGAGNTFLLIEAQNVSPADRKQFTIGACSQDGKHSCDGIVYIQKTEKSELYIWDFYNKDGSAAEMCGNAARCAFRFAREILQNKNENIRFSTVAGEISCREILSEDTNVSLVEVEMPNAQMKEVNKLIYTQEKPEGVVGFWIDSGVPHFVVRQEIAKGFSDLKELAKQIREHSDFFPEGTNVTFFEKKKSIQSKENPEYIAVTFERGVEDFTLACGTGAVAAAMAIQGLAQASVTTIEMPGGVLRISLQPGEKPKLIGPAEKIAEIFFEK